MYRFSKVFERFSSDVQMRRSSDNMKSCFQNFLEVFSSKDMKMSPVTFARSVIVQVASCFNFKMTSIILILSTKELCNYLSLI